LKFAVLLGLFYALSVTATFERLLYGTLVVNARISEWALNLLGQRVELADVTIRSARCAIAVRRGCDVIEPSWFLCAGIIAFRSSWREKAIGAALGMAVLLVLNVTRLITLFLIRSYCPQFFEPAHLEIWPVLLILAIGGIWIVWMRWSQRREAASFHDAQA
jgi:exosortase/archaeosortase family protein